jgi:hypothetical protein
MAVTVALAFQKAIGHDRGLVYDGPRDDEDLGYSTS